MMAADLVLRGGRVIDPSQDLDCVTDVAFADGVVVGLGDGLSGDSIHDVSGHIVTPGLVDLHTHVYWGGTSLGIDAEEYARLSGVTTSVDTGSAGPGNFPGFRRHVIDQSAVRILAYLNISFAGIYAFSHRIMVGESHDMRLMAACDAVEVAEANRDVIVGIKVRLGRIASGSSGIAPLDIALQVADKTGLPMMVHIDEPPPTYEAVVERLRPGDVLTHCYRPFPNAPIDGKGQVRSEVLKARDRGVIFDIGHGKGSFSWKTARAMMAAGFPPDVISSDVHQLCINGPAYDQVTTMSKFLCLGMKLQDIIARATSAPAFALRRPELGGLRPGSVGDATILSVQEGEFPFEDVLGEFVIGSQRLLSKGVVVGGCWWHPSPGEQH
ncbi:MAG TPA: amidohydrolase/deacetylase family metallohydrolase [Acidisoma sp.]|uniref:amidohydrolase/deacetylase family metallohydrolase n=1 Tax=Acidisoma sp. TaxID=1872115 RepID=UPI002C61E299|nr:amidohydrolase/deacetylase family metallohydrolase [Acidisoma sp.]HTI01955.1 amidohydrolase/deacetylase family metallohydrolase [Acidisoma sp.]